MRLRVLFACFLAVILFACQSAPETGSGSNSTLTASETPALTATIPPTVTQTTVPISTISPEILQEQASLLCENSFSALVESGPLTAPFAVMKSVTYAEVPAWELAHPLPHLGSLSADDVRTVFCISETRTQVGT